MNQETGRRLQSIQNAIELFERCCKGSRKWTENGAEITYSASCTNTTDLLAVVVRLSLRSSSYGGGGGEIWIADPSLSSGGGDHNDNDNNVSVLVSFYGNQAARAIQEQQQHDLRVGSIIRINGLSLKRKIIKRGGGGGEKYSNNNNNGNRTTKSTQPSITYEFQQSSWENPSTITCAGGVPWFLLAHVSDHRQQQKDFLLGPESERRRRIPPEIIETTCQSQIQDLIQWFRKSKFYSKDLLQAIEPVPCQRRFLEDMVSSLGVICNVIVKVTNVETITEAAAASAHQSKKRRRLSPTSGRKLLIVSVSDGRHTTIPFLLLDGDSIRRFKSILKQGNQSGQSVLLNSVVCRKGREISTTTSWSEEQGWRDEIVLLTTSQTNIVLLPPNNKEPSLLWKSNNNNELAIAHETQAPFSQTQLPMPPPPPHGQNQKDTTWEIDPPSQCQQQQQQQRVSPPRLHFFTASQTQQPASQAEGQQLPSQPNHFFTATQPSSQPEENINDQQKDTKATTTTTTTTTKQLLVLEAPLRSIHFPDLNLTLTRGHRTLRSPNKLLSVLIAGGGDKGARYREAKLVLRRTTTSTTTATITNDDTWGKKIRVSADSNGMKNLCGGLPIEELICKDQPNQFGAYVASLLQGLLEEKTPLRWFLQPQPTTTNSSFDDHYDCVLKKVTLIKL